jgi:tetratricopeptide (TPR) repeat protein
MPAATALLETLHDSDRTTPIPAMMLSYWSNAIGTREDVLRWRKAATERLHAVDDSYLSLLARYFESDTDGSFESSLQYSGALIRLRPQAWFFRLARAHRMNERGLREAALKELQAIDVDRLGHRKLVDAIADRASLGDLAGAQALVARMQPAPEDPERAQLQARLAYTSGDLAGARDHYLETVRLARRSGRFDIEARGLLWAGVYTATLGDYGQARGYLEQAKERLSQRMQYTYATDAAVVLAHIAAMTGNRDEVAKQIDAARKLVAETPPGAALAMLELAAARLTGEPIRLSGIDASVGGAALDLMQARAALQKGAPAAAREAFARALGAGIGDSGYAEEAALLARDLQLAPIKLGPIDPPFAPYQRFAARWMLGEAMSVVP